MTTPRSPDHEVITLEDAAALGRRAAETFVALATEAIADRGRFCVALSGGSTPTAMYRVLASDEFRSQVEWSHVQVFFSDERFVPLDSPESNYHTANEGLFSKVGVPESLVHPVPTTNVRLEEAAARYEDAIRSVFEADPPATPRFDLIFLGMGPDGHTASLFPGTEALNETTHLVAANYVPRLEAWRITFTYRLIDAAANVVFLIQGADKRDRVGEILKGDSDLPAARVRPANGRLIWLVERAAMPARYS